MRNNTSDTPTGIDGLYGQNNGQIRTIGEFWVVIALGVDKVAPDWVYSMVWRITLWH